MRSHVDNQVCKQHAMHDRREVWTPPVTNVGTAVRHIERTVNIGGPSHMARTRRRSSGIDRAVKRTVRRVKTTARRRASSGGGDLLKAVQGLIKALPIGELEKRLAGLEKTVARLEGSARGAVRRAVGGG